MSMGQKYAAYDSTGAIFAFYDSEDSPVPSGVSVVEITEEQWQTCLATPGYSVASGALIPPPPPTPAQLLAIAQASQIAAVTAAYNAAIQVPVTFSTSAGVSKTFQADSGSQDVLLIATTGYNLAGATPTGFYWVSSDNTQVPFVLADLKGLYGAMLAQGNAAFQKLQTLKSQIRAAGSPSDVAAAVWS